MITLVNNWLVAVLLVVSVLSLQLKQSHQYKVGVGGVREEADTGPYVHLKRSLASTEEPGNNNKKSSPHKPVAGGDKMKASFTNKEFVFGDEEEEEAAAKNAADKQAKVLSVNPIAVEFGSEQIVSAGKQSEPLERKQRTDQKHPHHQDSPLLYKFHRMADMQKKLAAERADKFDFDYDSELDRLLASNAKLFENEMKVKEMMRGQTIGLPFIKVLLSEDSMNENGATKKKPDSIIKKPVNVIKYKDSNVFIEKDRNQKSRMSTSQNPFFYSDSSSLFDDINIDSSTDNRNGQIPNQSNSVKSQPALKQQSSLIDKSSNTNLELIKQQNDYLFIFVVTGCVLAGVVAVMAAGVCWYTVHNNSKPSSDNLQYSGGAPKFSGSSGSIKSKLSSNSGDRRLAQSAQMYHYQHQKQQMIAMEKANNDTKPDNSDNSEGETEEGDYTVYECPGLAPTGEMEVKNPLFKEDFSASSNNILSSSQSISSMPPAYSSVAKPVNELQEPEKQQQQPNLIEMNNTSNQPTTATSVTPAQENNSVLISLNDPAETSTTSAQKQ